MSFSKSISAAFAALLPNCRQASRFQSGALEQKLSMAKRIGLKLHLLLCVWCRRYGRQIRCLHHAAHEHSDQLADAAPQILSAAARDRIKQKLKSGA